MGASAMCVAFTGWGTFLRGRCGWSGQNCRNFLLQKMDRRADSGCPNRFESSALFDFPLAVDELGLHVVHQ